MTRSDFLRREDRRRSLVAWGLAFCFYALAFLVTVVLGLDRVKDLAELPSPVWVSLEGPAEAPEAPPPGPPEEAELPKAEAELPAVPSSVPTPVPEPAPQPAPKVQAAAANSAEPKPSEAPGAGLPAAAEAEPAAEAVPAAPPEPWVPGARPQGTRITSEETSSGSPAQASGGFSTRIRGAEQGNSLETVLGAQAGKAGRSLYVPIYLYMPLPTKLEEALVNRIAPSQRERLLSYYQPSTAGYQLKRTVPLPERDELWTALEKAGYDPSKAEYKAGGRLRPVSLNFVVTAPGGGGQPRLEAVELTASSGDLAVDEAVLYGFKRAGFFNATDGAISGTFTYSFK